MVRCYLRAERASGRFDVGGRDPEDRSVAVTAHAQAAGRAHVDVLLGQPIEKIAHGTRLVRAVNEERQLGARDREPELVWRPC